MDGTDGGTVEVVHCAGWDPAARTAVGVMSEERARARDAAGEPYAVLLGGAGRPRALLQVDWGHHYLGVFLFDERARRVRSYDYRELAPGLLHLCRYDEWRHASAGEPEFPERGWHFTLTSEPGREMAGVVLDHGGSFHTGREVPERHRTLRRAEFGDWTGYVDAPMLGFGTAGPPTLVPGRYQPGPEGPVPAAGAPWTAPAGLRPRHLEALFTPGSRFADRWYGTAVVTEPERAGVLRLPTGRVVAADPGTLDRHDEPFTVPVPPGDHPVLLATMRWEEEGWRETTAAMLRVSDRPTATWELAVRPGQDVRLLDEGGFYGFGVDTGMGAFLDASGREALAAAYAERPESGEVADPATGTNLIAYHSGRGDGSYPVWIGRTAGGEVTCLVADMLVLHGARALPPTAPGTAAFLTPAQGGGGPVPEPGEPGAAAAFLRAVADDVAAFRAGLPRR